MKNEKIWSYLIHLSYHMWDDENTPPRSWYAPPRYTENNNVSVKAWDEIVAFLAECKYNMLIVDVGDAIQYESHPEISAPDAWDKDFLKIVLNYKINGTKSYKYSDAAYYLISRVVAKISGQKLDVYLKSRLFDKCDYKDYTITKCPEGHPIGATQFFLRPEDVVKLGRIYLNGGTYNNQRIISQDWVNQVILAGYELNPSNNGYGKGGMLGQYLYVNFKHNVAVAWLSETDAGTENLGNKLKSYMT